MSSVKRAERVKRLAQECGFDLCGIAPPVHDEAADKYDQAMAAGYGADMAWLKDNAHLRRDPAALHPGTRSIVVLGMSYADSTPGYLEEPPSAEEGWIARYAQGKDYHIYVRKRLIKLVKAFEADPQLGHSSFAHRVFVDTGPFLEKAYAQLGGIGWIGKNTLLLNRTHGSWVFLAVVLTPLELAPDEPGTDHCGSCTRCLDACPTDAFPEPYVLDARKCIATWTIESPNPGRDIVSEQLGQHVFGCDICQEVCPWNRKVPPSRHAPMTPRAANIRPRLDSLVDFDDASFKLRFPASPVRRTDGDRLAEVAQLIIDRNNARDLKGGS